MSESVEFYDLIFVNLLKSKKEVTDETVSYWGNIGLVMSEQKNIVSTVDPDYRLGFHKLSIRVNRKELVNEVYKLVTKMNFPIEHKPKRFDYSNYYYSTCIYDPDYNKIEFYYSE